MQFSYRQEYVCKYLSLYSLRNIFQTGLAIVDRSHHQPDMETDIFADEDGFRAMYTPESAALLGKGLSGSVANVNLMGEDDHTPMVELIPRDPSTSKAFSLSLSLFP